MIYIVDIDGTICDTLHIGGEHRYDASIPHSERIEHFNQLYREGHTIIYWTARGGTSGIDWTEHTTAQLTKWGCLYNELRMNKPVYDYWVDDKAHNVEEYFK